MNSSIIYLLLILLLLITYTYKKFEKFEKFETFENPVTNIMENVPDVPTIKLVETQTDKNLIQRVLSKTSQKVSFKINVVNSDYVTNVPDYLDYNFAGKGLVIAASGTRYRYITGLYSNLYTLRKYHKSNIPIEIFYVGKSEEFSSSIKNLIIGLGNIRIINLMDRIDTNLSEEELRGYQTKPLSVLCSTFSEIILMDADALCFVDPQYLFMSEGYESNGMVLFRDYVDCLSFISQDFIETIGIGVEKYCRYTDNFEIDSSCVIINKEKYWDALYTICIVNVKSDSYHKSKNVLGDKDTWVMGSMFVNMKPYISRQVPQVMISSNNKLIIGHLQSTEFANNKGRVFTHLNNQKLDFLTVDLTGWTHAFIKNPRNGEEINIGEPLPTKILDCFLIAKEAMKILMPNIPKHLVEKNVFIEGVSKGLIQ